jgi:tetratricopeptide (TPR) repeat protein
MTDYVPRVDTEMIAALEETYKDMPEYWQMRYFIAYNERYNEIRAKSFLDPPPLEIAREMNLALEKAVEVAPDDPLSLWLLATKYNFDEDILPEEKALPQLRECVRLATGQAFYHADLAECLMVLGEYEEAIESYRAANAAPMNWSIAAFPRGYLRMLGTEVMREHEDVVSSLAACILSPALFDAGEYIDTKDRFKEAVVAFNLNGDLDNLNVMHQYACRIGLRERAAIIEILVADIFTGILRIGVTELGAFDDDESALKGVARLNELQDSVKDVMRDHPYTLKEKYFTFDGVVLKPKYEGTQWVEPYLRELVDETLKPRKYRVRMRKLLRRIARFDYTDPAAFAR